MESVILYNRTRAFIDLDYDPIYSADEAMAHASSYYYNLLNE